MSTCTLRGWGRLGTFSHVSPKLKDTPYGATESGDRLFRARHELLGISQGVFGERSGIGRLQVNALERGGNQGSSRAMNAKLAAAFGVSESVFSEYFDGQISFEEFKKARNSPPGVDDVMAARMKRRATELSIHNTAVLALLGERGDEMRELPEEMRRAAWGVVHVSGYPIEQTLGALATARAKLPSDAKLPAEVWYGLIKDELPRRPGSGTHPAASLGREGSR